MEPLNKLSFGDLEHAVGQQCRFEADKILVGRQNAHPKSDTHLGRGFFATHEIRDGLTLTISGFTADREISGTAEFDAGLFIIVLIDGGPRRMQCAGSKLTLMPGTCHAFFMSEPTLMHSITPRGSEEKMVCIRATSEWLDGCGLKLPDFGSGVRTFQLGNDTASHIGALFGRTIDSPLEKLACEALTLMLVAAALDIPGDYDAPLSERMLLVRKVIDADPCGKHTLQSLSAAAGLGVTTLKTGFPKVYGTTVFGYIRNIRMETARAALASRRWSVAEAAYAVGYNHPASFSTAYRRHFGHSPKLAMRPRPADLSRKNSDL